jgi:hypothetical protein
MAGWITLVVLGQPIGQVVAVSATLMSTLV